jgi:hypothetical protein
MNRRGFLQTCLALAAAPAIVRAESIMRIWTPPQNIGLLRPGVMHMIQMQRSWLGAGTTKWFLDGRQVDEIRGVESNGFDLHVDGVPLITQPYQPATDRQISLSIRRDTPAQHTLGSVTMEYRSIASPTTYMFNNWSHQ